MSTMKCSSEPLDLVIQSLVSSPQFTCLENKNWESLCRLIPGSTVKQCQQRYEEYMRHQTTDKTSSNSRQSSTLGASSTLRPNSGHSNTSDTRPNSSGKSKALRDGKEGTAKFTGQHLSSSEHNALMVIHVSDEAKKLERDFQCPRDLLISEMKYFAEYLSSDNQRSDEVDISVHCDVDIFDWLMRYVKRKSKKSKENQPLGFELSNFTSILISSHFLKMDSLVEECIEYCYKNINELIASHANMACIKDNLVSRIAEKFSHNEADNIRDRKDKFKGKVFAKKLEGLFDPDSKNPDSPENASTLYRCSACKRLLTSTIDSRLPCLQSRLFISSRGKLQYRHVPDPLFDINSYILELKNQPMSWRDVYWRIWGLINYLMCSRCGQLFQCTELGHCKFHPENLQFDSDIGTGLVGVYPCCNQQAMRFDPTEVRTGCKVRDHVVNLDELNELCAANRIAMNRVYEDLLAHRDAICLPYEDSANANVTPSQDRADTINIFVEDEIASGMYESNNRKIKSALSSADERSESVPRLHALTIEREVSFDSTGYADSDDDLGCDEDTKGRRTRTTRRSRFTVDPQAILLDGPDFSTTKQRKWDSTRSMRWNQDAQREEDLRRMNEMVDYLVKLRLTSDKAEKMKQKEMSGGHFCKLEAQWKAANMPLPKPNPSQFRAKPARLTTLANKLA